MTKVFYYSKTFWFNFVLAVILIAQAWGASDLIPPKVALAIALAGNIILRFLSNERLQMRTPGA